MVRKWRLFSWLVFYKSECYVPHATHFSPFRLVASAQPAPLPRPPRRHPSPTHRSLSTIRSSLSFVGYFVLLLWLQFSLIQKSRRLRLAFIRFFGVFSSPPPKLCMYRYIRLLSYSPPHSLFNIPSSSTHRHFCENFTSSSSSIQRTFRRCSRLLNQDGYHPLPVSETERPTSFHSRLSLSFHPTITPFQHFIFLSYFCSSWF